MESQFSQTGLSIHVADPYISGLTTYDDNLTSSKVSGYTHSANVEIGFDACQITIDADQDYIEEWFENGLERDITVYNAGGQIVYQGWVNQLDVAFGALALTRGPILNLCNLMETAYTPVDTSVNPPIKGTARKTIATYITASRNLYGTWHKVVSAGEITDVLADQFQATYLAENSYPETGQSLSLGGSGASPRLTLQCLGYGHWLQAYPVAETTDTFRTVTNQIQAVIALSPNAIFSTDYSAMAANALLVPSLELNDKMALDYIKSLVALGDASNNRWMFGVYEDRKVYYSAVPTTILYNYRLSSQAQGVMLEFDQSPVYPWDIRPGQWLQSVDLLIGRSGGTLREDPRNLFIESVEYTAPFTLKLNGKKVNTIPQMLARMGAGQL